MSFHQFEQTIVITHLDYCNELQFVFLLMNGLVLPSINSTHCSQCFLNNESYVIPKLESSKVQVQIP